MSALTELFYNDIIRLGDIRTNHVPSEETLRFMLYTFNSASQLKADLIHRDQLAAHLENLIKSYKPSQGTVRYQVLLETGSRGIAKQGDKGNIHYAALDLQLNANGTRKCILADALNGDSISITPLENCAKKYKIDLYKVGGKNKNTKIIMQADDYHCPIFSIEFLLKIYEIDIFENIDSIADENRVISWMRLSPSLVWNSQSLSFLFNYVDNQQLHRTVKKDNPRLTTEKDLHGNTFSNFLALGFYKNPDEKSKYFEKIQNNAIKFTARILSCETWNYFLKHQLTDAHLLYIFYKPHKSIHDMLTKYNKSTCLLPFVFYNLGFWDFCLKNKQFQMLFTHEKFIDLLDVNLINIKDLLKLIAPFYIIDDKVGFDKDPSLNSNVINSLIKNLSVIDIILKNYKQMPENNKPPLLKILTKTTTQYLLSFPVIARIVAESTINIEHLLEIPLSKINFHKLNSLEDYEKINYLKLLAQPLTPTKRTPTSSPSKILRKKVTTLVSEDDSNCISPLIFNVPDANDVEVYRLPQIVEPSNESIRVSPARLVANSASFLNNPKSNDNQPIVVKEVTNTVTIRH